MKVCQKFYQQSNKVNQHVSNQMFGHLNILPRVPSVVTTSLSGSIGLEYFFLEFHTKNTRALVTSTMTKSTENNEVIVKNARYKI